MVHPPIWLPMTAAISNSILPFSPAWHDNTPTSSLVNSSLSLLLSNRVEEEYTLTASQIPPLQHELASRGNCAYPCHRRPHLQSSTVKYSYPAPCSSVSDVQESTSTLIAARAYSKAGYQALAWEALDSLFAVQGANGFLPRYRYPPGYTVDYPNEVPEAYRPPNSALASVLGLQSSGRVSAPPFHASFILDVFYLGNETDVDMLNLESYFRKLCDWHDFLHGIIRKREEEGKPLYNVVHPWESEVELYSPLWNHTMRSAIARMKEREWKMPYDISPDIKGRKDYPGDEIYNASMFLLECISDAGSEEEILEECPFAMLDVGYMAALAKSDQDLIRIGDILRDKNSKDAPGKGRWDTLTKNANRSSSILNEMWDTQSQSFLSRLTLRNETSSTPVDLPVVVNFMAFYGISVTDPFRLTSAAFQLFGSEGSFSFSCGEYPLFSYGECHSNASIRSKTNISPLFNYYIAKSIEEDASTTELAVYFIRNSTLNLICQLPNTQASSSCPSPVFSPAYNIWNYTPFDESTLCDVTSTLTAAISYDILLEDKLFEYESAPPLPNVWVLVLIGFELFIAFSIGVVCLILSFNVMRRIKADEEFDTFIQEFREQREMEGGIRNLYGGGDDPIELYGSLSDTESVN